MRLSGKKRDLLEAVTREALYDAAVKILKEEGWKGLTMEKLAQGAGVAKGTIYNYFESKGDVLFFVMKRNGGITAEKLSEISKDVLEGRVSASRGLEEALEVAASGMYRNRHVIAAIGRAFEEDPSLMARKREKMCCDGDHPLGIIRRCMKDIIAAGVKDGSLRAVDPDMAETIIHCTMMGLGRLFAVEGVDSGLPADRIGGFLKTMILHGLTAKAEGVTG
ncbi:MAG: TetR/AcrR family transcriptional regulator [Thermanaerothrix sp.]|nr:TetR/AcrR family transcriptional regulator [Thermanaerothrix sp.]